LARDVNESNILQSHLEIVMRGLKDYISDQNREVIESAIHTLKEELDFDAAAISHLHFAIYLFQESVSIYLFLLLTISVTASVV
jgi:mitogen-activated protein kinase kinase kinase 5